jgi:hypothetical protein
MKRTLIAVVGATALILAGCSSEGGDNETASSAAPSTEDGTAIHAPTDEVTFDDGVKFKLTGWGSYTDADASTPVVYTVLYGQAANTGADVANWEPMATFVPEGHDSVDYTVLEDLDPGVEGVFRGGSTADVSWGFAMPAAALKSGTFTLFGSTNWFGDFSVLPQRTPPAPVVEPTTTTPTPTPTFEPEPTVEETVEETVEADPPVGYTGAPTGPPTALPEKAIAYCMDDPVYQKGTTMFTDGTTGWTQECAG